MIAIIDYGMGNLFSVEKAFVKLGAKVIVTNDEKVILQADKVVLPGVGAFGDCMNNLEQSGLIPAIKEVVNSGKPFLGICLGL
ncbi:MAG: imidazole glycerol phosphate synthase subunit HisH, partial [Negativicutes bacterium]|nr:imidazole glycerol phosphate synthase subunit HisH [Negativicutes bacterium]